MKKIMSPAGFIFVPENESSWTRQTYISVIALKECRQHESVEFELAGFNIEQLKTLIKKG